MHYVYILRCKDHSLYCGQTTDLKRRIAEHNKDPKKSAKYLRSRLPAKLVYTEELESLGDALRREHVIKKMSKSAKEKLVNPHK